MFYATKQSIVNYHANYAARHVKQWGIYSASRYALKRGVPAELLIKSIRELK